MVRAQKKVRDDLTANIFWGSYVCASSTVCVAMCNTGAHTHAKQFALQVRNRTGGYSHANGVPQAIELTHRMTNAHAHINLGTCPTPPEHRLVKALAMVTEKARPCHASHTHTHTQNFIHFQFRINANINIDWLNDCWQTNCAWGPR